MKLKNIFLSFLLIFVTTLVVSALVSFLYSFVAHGTGAVDWETSFRMAITLGILLTWLLERERRAKQEQQ